MRRPPILGLDIDGVLADFVGAYSKLLVERHGKPLPEAPTQWEFPLAFGYTQEEVDQAWAWIAAHPEWWLGLRPLEESQLVLPPTADYYFVTARPASPGTLEATEAWLCQCGVSRPRVIMANRKGLVAAHLELDAFIDDHPGNLQEIAACSPKTALTLCRRPWNQHTRGKWAEVDRISEWLASSGQRPSTGMGAES